MGININFSQLNSLNTMSMKKIISEGEIAINLANTNTFHNEIHYLVNCLCPKEQELCRRIPLERVREKFIIHRALLRLQLATYLDQSPSSIVIESGEFGKPALRRENNSHTILFNLSHSENYVLFAFNKNYELGIDIEENRSFSHLSTMASMVLSPSELAELTALPIHEQNQQFLTLWTKKEAMSKALGQGLNMNFRELNCGFHKSSQRAFCQAHSLNLVDISRPPYFYATLVCLTKQTQPCHS